MASNTSRQTPRRDWRKRRMVGYQGESARPVSQRHSASLLSATQTGTAKAPARCATEVSHATTRSRHAIAAAVSTNASAPASKSAPSVSTRIEGGRFASCSSPKPFCSEMSLTPATSASGANAVRGMERARSASGSGFPCQTTPILKPSAPMRLSQRSRRAGSAARYGTEAGIVSSRVPKACGRLLIAICASKDSPSGGRSANRSLAFDDDSSRTQPRRADKGRLDPSRGHQRQIAKELDRIAEAVIVEHEHALAPSVPGPLQVSKRVPSASASDFPLSQRAS